MTSYTLLEATLGTGIDPALLERALTHRSYAYENGGLPNNERLEFLGDAVLGLVIADALYRLEPELPEGDLAKLRSSLVSMRALAGVARSIELGRWMRLGKGEEGSGGRDKPSILADTMEAIIGAVYLDRGLDAARTLVRALFDPLIAASTQDGAGLDWKTTLQELSAARGFDAPRYEVTDSGPDHDKWFTAAAVIDGRPLGEGSGRTKKEAEQIAAEAAWRALGTGA